MITDNKNVKLRVCIKGEEVFWGPGVQQIMEAVVTGESLREACRRTGISYSKARKIINRAEKELNMVLLERQQGGKNGGLSYVTDEGKRIMVFYESLDSEIKEFAEKKYSELRDKFFFERE